MRLLQSKKQTKAGTALTTHATCGNLERYRHIFTGNYRIMDPSHPSYVFSQRAQNLTSSTIREILKVTVRPEIISFAGGLPSPEGFPIDVLNQAFARVLENTGKSALQYGPTEGYEPLRQWVVEDLKRAGAHIDVDEVLIVSGSQQALDMLGKLF